MIEQEGARPFAPLHNFLGGPAGAALGCYTTVAASGERFGTDG